LPSRFNCLLRLILSFSLSRVKICVKIILIGHGFLQNIKIYDYSQNVELLNFESDFKYWCFGEDSKRQRMRERERESERERKREAD
jgi:hypothetical protein